MKMQIKKMGDIFQLSGQKRAGSESFPVMSITMHHGLIDQSDKFKKRVASINTSNYKIVYKNELVVGFPIDEGVIGFQTKYEQAIVSPAYDIWKLKDDVSCNIDFIGRYLRSNTARHIYASKMRGAVARRRSITKDDFLSIQIPFPPLDDQIRIASVLNRVEKLIAKRKESINALDELLKSAFLEMFGDPVMNEKGWEKRRLGNLGSLGRGVSKHRPRNAPELLGGKYPLIQTGDVANSGMYITEFTKTYSEIGFKQSKLWKKGTLCITIAANIAKTGILAFDSCFPDSVVGFVPGENEVDILYIHALFSFFQRILEKNAPQAAQKNINLDILQNLRVPKPPLSLQKQFAILIEKIESLKARYKLCLTELENLYGSLSQRAFKGELDLSKVPVVYETAIEVGKIDMTGSPDVELKIELELTDNDLVDLIKKYSGKVFSFDELWKEIEKQSEKRIPSRNDVQNQIIKLLESDKANLQQVFDILTSQTYKNDSEKQIAFRGNYEN